LHHFCSEKAITIVHNLGVYEFVALGILHAMPMSHKAICGHMALQHFSTLSHKRHNFRKKKLLNLKCAFRFYLQICLKHFYFRKNWARYDQKCTRGSQKV